MHGARIVARDRRDRLGEGPIWSPRDGCVYWTDIIGQRLNRLRLADDRVDTWAMPNVLGWIIERRTAPGFVAGLGRSIVRLTLDPLRIEEVAVLDGEPPSNRVNDSKADSDGRIFLGTMPFGCDVPTGSLYRLAGDVVERLEGGYTGVTQPPAAAFRRQAASSPSAASRTRAPRSGGRARG